MASTSLTPTTATVGGVQSSDRSKPLCTLGSGLGNCIVQIIALGSRVWPSLRRPPPATKLMTTIVKADRAANPALSHNDGNIAAAVVTADKVANNDQVTWLDSDIFFIGEPQTLTLNEAKTLRSRSTPRPRSRRNTTYGNYWRRLCGLLGVNFDDFLWQVEGKFQKPNCNSGVFTGAAWLGFAERYWSAFRTLLDSRLAQSNGDFFTVDQVILGLLAHGIRWKAISPEDHTFVATDQFTCDKMPLLDGVTITLF